MMGSRRAALALALLALAARTGAALPEMRGYGESASYGCYTAGTHAMTQCNTEPRTTPPGIPDCDSIQDTACFCGWAGASAWREVSSVFQEPVSCSGRYVCTYTDAGNKFDYMPCQEGLLYNPQAEQCQWPSDYSCPSRVANLPLPYNFPRSSDFVNSSSGVTCQGVAYDGYLSSCNVWFDYNNNGVQDAAEYSATIKKGAFVVNGTDVVPQVLGIVHVDPAPSSIKKVTKAQVEDPNAVLPCYDMATLNTLRVPLAAPWPTSCQQPIAISPLTTLMAYGVSTNDLIRALGLNSVFATSLGKIDTFRAAALKDSEAKKVIKAEIKLLTTVTTAAEALSPNQGSFATLGAVAFKAGADLINEWIAQHPAGSRRLLQTTTMDFANQQLVQSLLTTAQRVAVDSLPATLYRTVASDAVLAISNAVASINKLTDSATTLEDVQKALVVVSNSLAASVSDLVNGVVTASAFETATSTEAFKAALAAVDLPGTLGVEEKKSKTGAIVGGVVGGVGGALLIAGVAFFLVKKGTFKKGIKWGSKKEGFLASSGYVPPPVAEAAPAQPWR